MREHPSNFQFFHEVQEHNHKMSLIRKLSGYLRQKGFVLTVVGDMKADRLTARVVGPDGSNHLFSSDEPSIISLIEWAAAIHNGHSQPDSPP